MNRHTLRNLRTRQNWTKAKSAHKLGLSLNGYDKKERGKRKITRQEKRLIASFRLIERLKAKIKAKR